MNRRTMTFIALAITMIYGVLFAVIPEDSRGAYAAIGGVIVALVWIGVGMLGRDASDATRSS